jgi:hypothetical protein
MFLRIQSSRPGITTDINMSTWHEKLANRKQDQLDEERKKKVEVNDISFPSLGGSAWGTGGPKTMEDAPKPKLASLLATWDAKAKEDEEQRKAKAALDADHQSYHQMYRSTYRGFGNTHSRDEDTYYEDEYEDQDLPPVPTADTSSDWRTVERPVRKPKKSAIEKMMMEPETAEFPIEETSVWQTEGVWERER